MTTIELQAGTWRMALRPAEGGVVSRLEHDGRAVLRPTPDHKHQVLDAACFPLVPYANRIANGRFVFGGAVHRLPLNFGDHPHSLHGLGWQRGWDVTGTSPDEAMLTHGHDGSDGWPWRYQAFQHFNLSEGGLEAKLSVINASETPMPCGLGFHPYFVCNAGSRLHFDAGCVWQCDASMLPTHADRADHFGDWASGAEISRNFLIDNAYENWGGTARIEHSDGSAYCLSADGALWLHLYRPVGAEFFCAEPVSHAPDAVNRGGMPVIAPGETLSLSMSIECTARR